jgi:hypothetical protein
MPRITISYRRDDSMDITGRITDRLAVHFGREAVFRDIDNIPPGVDFRRHIDGVLGESDVILAILGPRWIGPRANQNRLASPADPVRLEIETALRKNKPVIPVLVSHAVMPSPERLPESMQAFAYRNAVSIDSGQNFENDVGRLIRAMEQMLKVDAADPVTKAPAATVEVTPRIDNAPNGPGASKAAGPAARGAAGLARQEAHVNWDWSFIRKPSNQRLLSWLGGGGVVVAAGIWALFTYIWPPHETPTAVCSEQGVAVGGNVSGSTITNTVQGGSPAAGPCADASKK